MNLVVLERSLKILNLVEMMWVNVKENRLQVPVYEITVIVKFILILIRSNFRCI